MKSVLKAKAVELRMRGLSYNEIRKEVPVAKSTLSIWLSSIKLRKKYQYILSKRRLDTARKGWETSKKLRILRTNNIKAAARLEIKKIGISKNELFYMGLMLYWAEGAKQKEYKPSVGVIFSNSDSKMINLFIQWLRQSLGLATERIRVDVYIHESHSVRSLEIRNHWMRESGISDAQFDKIYYKKHKLSTNRRNRDGGYFGVLRVKVTRSTDLNRKIAGWIEGVV